ncbi:aminotransferase class I/II-fold pyridoxal phosphate-dependent enzyme [Amycolatopsis roodepoortensis]|uniref:aminotransferase class I/II-fold pyridoxal phosphate-dependent enzyme n=1 Tax=Amycolatopsis roodepoortensis TaxID=700274 RepID=UPI00214B62BA|nr:aminotransferase class I/II-fold pyridoxal phosphate-dependent enzyme [Amycolatopsis roodepoortensis]UUV32045.1 aminotransferase class I/II-fold pyridoxal phosphate-dependent enzyme [Amycolatopsis roodepoortensis]
MSTTADVPAPHYSGPRRIGGITRLAANELPHPPPSPVRAAVADNVQLNRYPDPACTELIAALAKHLRATPEQIMLGAGASAILHRLIQIACTEPDHAVLWTSPAFAAFDVFARQAGARAQRVPHAGGETLDLDAMLAAITPSTRVVVVVNPHNPTGAIARQKDLRAFLNQVPNDVLVVLDEAYREFVTDPHVVDGAELAQARWAAGQENVVVVRTFSKAFGLAATRIGYGIAPVPLARAIRDASVPREIGAAAQSGAIAALTHQHAMRHNVARVTAERTRLLTELRRIGYAPSESQGNFVWLPLAEDSGRFAAHCYDDGVLVLDIADHGVRVTVGSPSDNDAFLRAAHTWVTGHGHILNAPSTL